MVTVDLKMLLTITFSSSFFFFSPFFFSSLRSLLLDVRVVAGSPNPLQGSGTRRRAGEEDAWDRFSIDPRLLPAAVPPRVAEKALFSGKAATVLKSMAKVPGDASGTFRVLPFVPHSML